MCTGRPLLIALLVAILGAGSGVVAAQDPRLGPELLTAAERSFSTFAFGTPEGISGLTIVIREDCEVQGECSYEDANHVAHFFWEGELVVKSVEAGDQWVAALGYAGWGDGQLDEEMTRHGWFAARGDSTILFDTATDERWNAAFRKEGIDPRLLVGETGEA